MSNVGILAIVRARAGKRGGGRGVRVWRHVGAALRVWRREGRAARGGGEAEGVVHMRRNSRRLKVTLGSPSKCSALLTTLFSVPFTSERLSGHRYRYLPERGYYFSCAQLNLWQHPVDPNVTRSSPFIAVIATDKTNRYASSTRCRKYQRS